MMTYDKKSEESLEASEILKENKKYNSCVNRAYYSLYQRILFKLDSLNLLEKVKEDCKKQTEKPPKGSHEFTIEYFLNQGITKKNHRPQVNTCAYSLKKLRHRADYKKDDITERDVNDAIQFAKHFKNLVK